MTLRMGMGLPLTTSMSPASPASPGGSSDAAGAGTGVVSPPSGGAPAEVSVVLCQDVLVLSGISRKLTPILNGGLVEFSNETQVRRGGPMGSRLSLFLLPLPFPVVMGGRDSQGWDPQTRRDPFTWPASRAAFPSWRYASHGSPDRATRMARTYDRGKIEDRS